MKKRQLYNNEGDFFPFTHTEAVLDSQGRTVEQRMIEQERKLSGGESAAGYPYLDLGTFANISSAKTKINEVFESRDPKYQGHLRMTVNGQTLWIDQYAINWSEGYWMQVAFGVFKPSNDGTELVADYATYHVSYRFRNAQNNDGWHNFAVTGLTLSTINGHRIDTGEDIIIGNDGTIVLENALDPTSENGIQNKVVAQAIQTLSDAISAISSNSIGSLEIVDYWGSLPSNASDGQKAFYGSPAVGANPSTYKIYTYASGSWGSGSLPKEDTLYLRKEAVEWYNWNGTAMVEKKAVNADWSGTGYNGDNPIKASKINERFNSLEETVGDENGGLVNDVETLTGVVLGNGESQGLEADVEDLESTIYGDGSEDEGLVGQVRNLEASIASAGNGGRGNLFKLETPMTGDTIADSSYSEDGEDDYTSYKYSLVKDASDRLFLRVGIPASGSSYQYTLYANWSNVSAYPSLSVMKSQEAAFYFADLNSITIYKLSSASGNALVLQWSNTKIFKVTEEDGTITAQSGVPDWDALSTYSPTCTLVYQSDGTVYRLYLKVVASGNTYYYTEWDRYNAMPADYELADDDVLLYYDKDGKFFLCKYDSTEKYLISSGGNPVTGVVKAIKVNGGASVAPTDESGVVNLNISNLPTEIKDNGIDFTTFDYRKGNQGIFSFDKAPEEITTEDVDGAYHVPNEIVLHEGTENETKVNVDEIPIGPADATEYANWTAEQLAAPHLWTDYELTHTTKTYVSGKTFNNATRQTSETTSSASITAGSGVDANGAKVNAYVLKEILKDTSCVGFKLSGTYKLYPYFHNKKQGSITVGSTTRDAYVYRNGGSATQCYISKSGDNYLLLDASGNQLASLNQSQYNSFISDDDNIWYVYLEENYTKTKLTASLNKALRINIPRDFVIIGTPEIKTFIAYVSLFYTEHSLIMRDVWMHRIEVATYQSLYVNVQRGINILQATNCKFTSEGTTDGTVIYGFKTPKAGGASIPMLLSETLDKDNYNYDTTNITGKRYPKGHHIFLYSPNTRPYALFDGEYDLHTNSSYADSYQDILWPLQREYNGVRVYERKVKPDNCINHLYINGCTFEGGGSFETYNVRFVKSARITGNTFKEFYGCPLTIGCTNADQDGLEVKGTDEYATATSRTITLDNGETGYIYDGFLPYTYNSGHTTNQRLYKAQTKAVMSCPIYVAGNNFEGIRAVIKHRASWGAPTYSCAFTVENSVVYALHNTIKNIINGYSYCYAKDGALNVSQVKSPTTYDSYLSCMQVYYAHNTISDVVSFAKNKEEYGFCKSKNCNVAKSYGGCAEFPATRYWKYNHYSLDRSGLMSLWNEFKADYDTSIFKNSSETTYDESLESEIDDSVLVIRFNSSVIIGAGGSWNEFGQIVLKNYIFSNNIVDAGNGKISGYYYGNPWPTNSCDISENKFRAGGFTSDQWYLNYASQPAYTYSLFNIMLFRLKKYGSTNLNVQGNIFQFVGSTSSTECRVHLLSNRKIFSSKVSIAEAGLGQSNSQGDRYSIRDNVCIGNGNLSIALVKEKNNSGWSVEDMTVPSVSGSSIDSAEFNEMKTDVSDLQDSFGALSELLEGTDTEGLSDVKPENPVPRDIDAGTEGSKYIVQENGENVIKECIAVDAYATISMLFKKQIGSIDISSDNPMVIDDIFQFKIPLLSNEIVGPITLATQATSIMETAQAYLGSGSGNIQLTSGQTVVMKTRKAIQAFVGAFLTEFDYTSQGNKTNTPKVVAAGTFDYYGTDYIVRINPKNTGEAYAYCKNEIAKKVEGSYVYAPLVKLLSGSVIQAPGKSYWTGSVEGAVETWETVGTVSGGIVLQVNQSRIRLNLAYTIMTNLLGAINTLRTRASLPALVLQDDGTLVEESN